MSADVSVIDLTDDSHTDDLSLSRVSEGVKQVMVNKGSINHVSG